MRTCALIWTNQALPLRATGSMLGRASLLAGLKAFASDLGGAPLRWSKCNHRRCRMVCLARVGDDGRSNR